MATIGRILWDQPRSNGGDSVDAWLLAEPKLVNGRKKTVYPAVAQRMKLAEGFTRRLQTLGLHRREKPVPSLQEYLAARASEGTEPEDSA